MSSDEVFVLLFAMGMFSGVFIIYLGLRQRSQQLEMIHRERMAMIERGQIPLADSAEHRHAMAAPFVQSSRSLSVGIIVVGLGLALATIISVAAESPEAGIGVGGAVAILGAAFIVRAVVVKPHVPPHPMTRRPPIDDGPPV